MVGLKALISRDKNRIGMNELKRMKCVRERQYSRTTALSLGLSFTYHPMRKYVCMSYLTRRRLLSDPTLVNFPCVYC